MSKSPSINVEALLDLTLNEKELSKTVSKGFDKAFENVGVEGLSKKLLSTGDLRKDAQKYQAEMQKVMNDLQKSQLQWTDNNSSAMRKILGQNSKSFEEFRANTADIFKTLDTKGKKSFVKSMRELGGRKGIWSELGKAEKVFGGRAGFQEMLKGGSGAIFKNYGTQLREAQRAYDALGKLAKSAPVPKGHEQLLKQMATAPKEAEKAFDSMSKTQVAGARKATAAYEAQVKILKEVNAAVSNVRLMGNPEILSQLKGSDRLIQNFNSVTDVAGRHQKQQKQAERDRIETAKQTLRERIRAEGSIATLQDEAWFNRQLKELGLSGISGSAIGGLKNTRTARIKKLQTDGSYDLKSAIQHLEKLGDVEGALGLFNRGKSQLTSRDRTSLGNQLELRVVRDEAGQENTQRILSRKEILADIQDGKLRDAAAKYKYRRDQFNEIDHFDIQRGLTKAGRKRVEARQGVADKDAQDQQRLSQMGIRADLQDGNFKRAVENYNKIRSSLTEIERTTLEREFTKADRQRVTARLKAADDEFTAHQKARTAEAKSLLGVKNTYSEKMTAQRIQRSNLESKQGYALYQQYQRSGSVEGLSKNDIAQVNKYLTGLDGVLRAEKNAGAKRFGENSKIVTKATSAITSLDSASNGFKEAVATQQRVVSDQSKSVQKQNTYETKQAWQRSERARLEKLPGASLYKQYQQAGTAEGFSKSDISQVKKYLQGRVQAAKQDNTAAFNRFGEGSKEVDKAGKALNQLESATIAFANATSTVKGNIPTKEEIARAKALKKTQAKVRDRNKYYKNRQSLRTSKDALNESEGRALYDRFTSSGIKGIEGRDQAALKDYMSRMQSVLDRELKLVGSRFGKNSKVVQEAQRNLNQMQSSMTSFGTATRNATPQLAAFNRYMTNFIKFGIGYQVLGNLTRGVMQLGRSIAGLDEQMYSIRAISGSTEREMDHLSGTILKVAQTTKFSVGEIAQSAQVLAQAGVPVADMDKTLSAVANFAAATSSSLETSAGLLSTMREVFDEMDEQVVADQLTRVINISRTTADDLGTILSVSAQTAQQYQMSSEQYFAAVATLRNAGLKASTVGTGLRQAVTEVFNPSAKALERLSELYRQLGEDMDSADIRTRFYGFQQAENPLVAAISELRRLGYGGENDMAFQGMFNIRAMNALSALNSNYEQLAYNEARVTFGRASAEAAQIQLESLNATVDNFGAAITATGANILDGPVRALQQLTRSATEAVQSLSDLDMKFKSSGGGGLSSMTGAGFGGMVAGALGGTTWQGRLGRGALGAVSGLAGSYAAQTDDAVKMGAASLISISTGIMSIFGSVTNAAMLLKGNVSVVGATGLAKAGNAAAMALGGFSAGPIIGVLVALAGAFAAYTALSKGSRLTQLKNKADAAAQQAMRSEAELEELEQVLNEFSTEGENSQGTTAHSLKRLTEVSKTLEESINNRLGQIAGDYDQFLNELARYGSLDISERPAARIELAKHLETPELLLEADNPDNLLTELSTDIEYFQGLLAGNVRSFREWIDRAGDALLTARANGDENQAQYFGSLLNMLSADQELQSVLRGNSKLDGAAQAELIRTFLNAWANGQGVIEELAEQSREDKIESAFKDFKVDLESSNNEALVDRAVNRLSRALINTGEDVDDYLDRMTTSVEEISNENQKTVNKHNRYRRLAESRGIIAPDTPDSKSEFLAGMSGEDVSGRVQAASKIIETDTAAQIDRIAARYSSAFSTLQTAVDSPDTSEGDMFANLRSDVQSRGRQALEVSEADVISDMRMRGANSDYVTTNANGDLVPDGVAKTLIDLDRTIRASDQVAERVGDFSDLEKLQGLLPEELLHKVEVDGLNQRISEAERNGNSDLALELLEQRLGVESDRREVEFSRADSERNRTADELLEDPGDEDNSKAFAKAYEDFHTIQMRHIDEERKAREELHKFKQQQEAKELQAAERTAKRNVKGLQSQYDDALKAGDFDEAARLAGEIESNERTAIEKKVDRQILQSPSEKDVLNEGRDEELESVRNQFENENFNSLIRDMTDRSQREHEIGLEEWSPSREKFGATPEERGEDLGKELDHYNSLRLSLEKLHDTAKKAGVDEADLHIIESAMQDTENSIRKTEHAMESLPTVTEREEWESMAEAPMRVAKAVAELGRELKDFIDWGRLGEDIRRVTDTTETLGENIHEHLVNSVVDFRDALKDAIWESEKLEDALKQVGLALTRNIFDSAFDQFTAELTSSIFNTHKEMKAQQEADGTADSGGIRQGFRELGDRAKGVFKREPEPHTPAEVREAVPAAVIPDSGVPVVSPDPDTITVNGPVTVQSDSADLSDALFPEEESEVAEEVGEAVTDAMDDGFRSFGDTLKDLFSSIGSMFGGIGGGFSGMLGGLFSNPAKLATGGIISGGGTTTSDSIPGVIKGANGKAVRGIMLSNKESVLNAKATAALGEDFVHAANLGMVSKSSLGGMVTAAGYTINNEMTSPTTNVNVNAPDVSVQEGDTRIVNVLDSQLLDGYIQSREGEKSIVNVMQKYDVI